MSPCAVRLHGNTAKVNKPLDVHTVLHVYSMYRIHANREYNMKYVRKTIYAEYISDQIKEIAESGGGVFSFKDLAARMQISPTHNLRKQLRTHEKQGNLWIGYGNIGKHGTLYLYHIESNFVSPNRALDIPF